MFSCIPEAPNGLSLNLLEAKFRGAWPLAPPLKSACVPQPPILWAGAASTSSTCPSTCACVACVRRPSEGVLRPRIAVHNLQPTRHPAALRYAMYFRFYGFRHVCTRWGMSIDAVAATDVATSVVATSTTHGMVVVRRLTPLLRLIGSVVDDGGHRY